MPRLVVPGGNMEPALKKGAWSSEEDQKLASYIMRYGIRNWRQMPRYAGLARTGKSCRLRWMNYLRPDVRRGPFDMEEVATLVQLYQSLGNKWSAIAAQLPGRTDNHIKNFFHTHLKKLLKMKNATPPSRSKASIRTKRSITHTVASNDINNIVGAAPPKSPDNVPNSGNVDSQQNYQLLVGVNDNNFFQTPQDNNLMRSQLGYTSSSAITTDMNFSSSSDYDISAFWYNILAEAEFLRYN